MESAIGKIVEITADKKSIRVTLTLRGPDGELMAVPPSQQMVEAVEEKIDEIIAPNQG